MFGKVVVCNVHGWRGFIEAGGVYVGRANRAYGFAQSKLANRFIVDKHGDRARVVELYKIWLWKQYNTAGSDVYKSIHHLEQQLRRGEDVTLGCWCAPKACHADVIKALLEYLLTL
jgi:hypothetical protein